MSSTRLIQRLVLVAGAGAVVVSGALVACSAEKKEKPAEPANSAPAVAPTEKKNVGSFEPEVTAKPAPTAIPGNR